jgi:hypothetical protein
MHNIPDMVAGLDIGEIGQFSEDPKPYKFLWWTITPEYMYEGMPLGTTVPGEFMQFWACSRCDHLPYDRKTFEKHNCLFVPVKEENLGACTSCGFLKYKEVVGRVLYVVSQIISRTRYTKEDHRYRVWGWEYAENIFLGRTEKPLTIRTHYVV